MIGAEASFLKAEHAPQDRLGLRITVAAILAVSVVSGGKVRQNRRFGCRVRTFALGNGRASFEYLSGFCKTSLPGVEHAQVIQHADILDAVGSEHPLARG